MKLYDELGYVNINKLLERPETFIFIVGGRGTGKTFGVLKYVIEKNIKFMLMRRSQSELDVINKDEFSPFKALNNEYGWHIASQSLTKYNTGYYNCERSIDDDEYKPSGPAIGYSCALSTIAHLRGFDASDVELLIYDEFIPEAHVRPIKNEGAAFMNAYETINRNRELNNKKPLKVVCLANANDLANPLFLELGLVQKAVKLKNKGITEYIDSNRSLALYFLDDSPISNQKKNTALYKLMNNSRYSEMALNNNFISEDFDNVKSQNINMYNPVVKVGDIVIYKHKSDRTYYVSKHEAGSICSYTSEETDLKKFRRKYDYLLSAYYNDRIIYEEYINKVMLELYFKIR